MRTGTHTNARSLALPASTYVCRRAARKIGARAGAARLRAARRRPGGCGGNGAGGILGDRILAVVGGGRAIPAMPGDGVVGRRVPAGTGKMRRGARTATRDVRHGVQAVPGTPKGIWPLLVSLVMNAGGDPAVGPATVAASPAVPVPALATRVPPALQLLAANLVTASAVWLLVTQLHCGGCTRWWRARSARCRGATRPLSYMVRRAGARRSPRRVVRRLRSN